MEKQAIIASMQLEAVLPTERERLVRICRAISGDVDVTEDLVQEVMLEAWKHIHELRDPERRAQWLSGIARNVCLRWRRRQGRDQLQRMDLSLEVEKPLEELLIDDFDIELELERKELITLLDRALGLLPVETRSLLVKRYVEESSIAEIADQLGAQSGAVAMRLQRGRIALRRLLKEDLQQEESLLGRRLQTNNQWEETSIWCPLCGERRLQAVFCSEEGSLMTRCPQCTVGEGNDCLSWICNQELLSSLKGYKPAFTRSMKWRHEFYRAALQNSSVVCSNCNRRVKARIYEKADVMPWLLKRTDRRVLDLECPICHEISYTALEFLVGSLPEVLQFWQQHPRTRFYTSQVIEFQGRPALVTVCQSMTENIQLDVISAYEDYDVLGIYGGEAK